MPIEAPLKARFNNRHAGGGHLGVRLRPRRLSGTSCFRSGNLPLPATGCAVGLLSLLLPRSVSGPTARRETAGPDWGCRRPDYHQRRRPQFSPVSSVFTAFWDQRFLAMSVSLV